MQFFENCPHSPFFVSCGSFSIGVLYARLTLNNYTTLWYKKTILFMLHLHLMRECYLDKPDNILLVVRLPKRNNITQ